MINFEPCIRNFKSNGYAKVYIRVIKVKEVQYISTPYTVTEKQVEKTRVSDFNIIVEIAPIIKSYYNKLNSYNYESWTLKEVIEFLSRDSEEISFTKFYKEFTNDMIRKGRETQLKIILVLSNPFYYSQKRKN